MSQDIEAATQQVRTGAYARPRLSTVLPIIAAAAVIASALSWALGTLFGWDVMGETARHAVTFGVGGALSALMVALHVHYRIVPLLGVPATIAAAIVAMLGGIVAAVLIVRHLLLYAAGTAPWWPSIACAVAFVCVALCIAMSVVSIVALVATAVRNVRTRVPVFRGGSALLVGVIAGPAVLAGLMYTPDGYYTSLWHLVHAPRRSVWYDAREQLFSEVFDGYRCDALVVPFEAPVNSIDRIGRDLVARTLAATIAEQTGLCVADFDLVRRALGEQRRHIEWDSVYRLADRIGARWIVRGTASTTPDGSAAFLELTGHGRDAGSGSSWRSTGSIRFPRQPVSDELPPELPYLQALDTVPARLGFTAKPVEPLPPVAATRDLPDVPEGLLADTGSALDRAERLQFLASTLTEFQPEAESLWVRSLVALRHQPESDDDANALRARAWLYLSRRPYAEGLVASGVTPEARVVRELARGNLAASMAAVDALTSPIARVIGQIGVEGMRSAYDNTDGYEHRRDKAIDLRPLYAPFLYQAFSSSDWGGAKGQARAQLGLELRGVAIEDPWERVVLRALAKWVLYVDPGDLLQSDPASRAERSYAPLWRTRAAQWRAPAHDRLAERDLYEVLFALNRQAADRNLEMRSGKQALHERAMSEAMTMAPALRSNPFILSRTLLAIRWVGANKDNLASRTQGGAAFEFAKHLIATEDGETGAARQISQQHGIDGPWVDVPPRPHRAAGGWAAAQHAPRTVDYVERVIARNRRAALLARTGFHYVAEVDYYLRQLDREAEADAWLAANAGRFDGDPARSIFERTRIGQKPDPEARLAALMPRIDAGTSSWGYHYDATIALLQLHRPDEAQRVLHSWPSFRADDSSPVALANAQETLSALLMNVGETARAKQEAELALEYRTGSGSELVARARLGMIARDWAASRAAERENVERYDSNESRARSAWIAFLVGKTSDGTSEAIESARHGTALAVRALAAGARLTDTDPQRWMDDVSNRIERNQDSVDVPWKLAFELFWVDRPLSAATMEPVFALARPTAQSSTLLLKSYAAFRARDWKELLPWAQRLYASPVDAAGNTYYPSNYALPFYVMALCRAGHVADAAQLTARHREVTRAGHYYAMAQAVIDEAQGKRASALERLWQSFVDTDVAHYDPIHPVYLQLEIAELLYEETRDDRYRELMVDMARRYARAWPFSWAYGFAARYGKTAESRQEAIVALLYLDRRSMRLDALPATEIEQARKALEKHNPLLGAQ